MASIAGFGVYLPRYRIKLEEIHQAWGRSGGRGEKAVAAPDEDVLTMGVKAAQEALARVDIEGSEVGAVYFASVSSGYIEHAPAAQAAQLLGVRSESTVADFGLSTRAVTSALQACIDALDCGRVGYGLVIAADRLIARPGSDYELSYAAGAGALLLAKEGLAMIEGCHSCSSGFVGRFRAEGQFHAAVDERFVMQQGFFEHSTQAAQRLAKVTGITFEQFDLMLLQAPEMRWAARALAKLSVDSKKLVSTLAQIGYAGCGSFLIDLAYALERSKSGQRVLAVSYGPGGSDALALRVRKRARTAKSTPTVEEQLIRKEYVNYATYLRYSGLLGGVR